ncbi:unnamed protein product [Alopecurus aequalis]
MDSLFEPSTQANQEALLNPAESSLVFTERCIMPVTIKQIKDAAARQTEEGIVINHTAITTVRILGRIVDKGVSGDKGTFGIHDGTGGISGQYWVIEKFQQNNYSVIKIGDYACVSGRIICNTDESIICAYTINKIDDFNRITHHFLDSIHAHLQLEKVILPYIFSGTLEGVCIKVICKATNSDHATAKALLNDLASIGEIYNTTDDDRYKAT